MPSEEEHYSTAQAASPLPNQDKSFQDALMDTTPLEEANDELPLGAEAAKEPSPIPPLEFDPNSLWADDPCWHITEVLTD